MATVNKDFRIKNGLVVEGSTATVNGSNVLTEGSTEFLQDLTADMLINGSQSGITFTYNDSTGVIDTEVSSTPTFADKIIFEGATVDSYETTLQVTDPTADRTITLPNATTTLVGKDTTDTLTNKTFDTAGTGNSFQIQGNEINSYAGSGSVVILQTNPTIINPYVDTGININGATTGTTTIVASSTATGTITLPAATGTVALTSDIPSLSGYVTETGSQTLTNKTIGDVLTFNDGGANSTIDVDGNNLYITAHNNLQLSTVNADIELQPDGYAKVWGDRIVTEDASQTVTNKTISGADNTISNIGNASLVNDSITINGSATALGSSITLDTDDISEGTNKYYSDSLVDSHLTGGDGITYSSGTISADVAGGLHITGGNIEIDRSTVDTWYDTNGAASDVQDNLDTHTNASSGVHGVVGSVVGTSDTQTLTNKTISDSLKFNTGSNDSTIYAYGNDLTVYASHDLFLNTNSGNIVLQPDGTAYVGSASAGNEIATNSYVDNAVSGLDWKQAVNVLAVANVALSGSTPLSIDNHTVSDGYRVLLAAQSTDSQNGIYLMSITGGSYTLSRTADADAYGELVGAAVFVMEGDTYNNTSWVQSNSYLTDFTSQDWVQFSGNGSVVAGTGITVNGLEISVDRTTVDTWYDAAGTASSEVSTHNASSGIHGVSGNVVGTTDTQTLTNKTLTNPEISTIINGAATLTLPTSTGTIALTSDIPVLDTDDVSEGATNKYFTAERAEDAAAGMITSASHNGISVAYTDNGASSGTLAFTNEGVTDLTGTTDQISVSASTGSVTLSLPQSIASTSTPTFGGVTVGSVTLTDALIGTATQALTSGTATVVDSWAASSYSGAKYLVQMKKNNDIEIIEVLVAVDGNNNVYLTEYADVISNTQLGTTDADYSGGNVRLLVTASNGVTVKVQKTLIEA